MGLGAEIARALAPSGAPAVSFTYGRNKTAVDNLMPELRGGGIRSFSAPVRRLLSSGTRAIAERMKARGVKDSIVRSAKSGCDGFAEPQEIASLHPIAAGQSSQRIARYR